MMHRNHGTSITATEKEFTWCDCGNGTCWSTPTQQSVFEIDPATVKVEGEHAELAAADIPAEPIETSEWKSRDAGPVLRHRFRFGKTGNYMELQIPLHINGKPAY